MKLHRYSQLMSATPEIEYDSAGKRNAGKVPFYATTYNIRIHALLCLTDTAV